MTVRQLLNQFYIDNGISTLQGLNSSFFVMKFWKIEVKLPNPTWRRNALYIHDVQHIIFKKDTSWKGEAFIAGWEMGSKMWKHFPVGLLGLWAMGYSSWIHFSEVKKGFNIGINQIGIIDLTLTKEELFEKDEKEVWQLINKSNQLNRTSRDILFAIHLIAAQISFLSPLLLAVLIYQLLN